MAEYIMNGQDQQMTLLLEVLDEIKDYPADELDSAPSSDLAQGFLEKLDQVYEDASFRHSYSILSQHLGSYQADERDSIPVILTRIVELAKMREQTEVNVHIRKSIQKLLDHVELECLRLNRMDVIRDLADTSKRQQSDASEMCRKAAKDAEALGEKVKGFHEQSITILGIFSAVVIGFMAEISLFNKGFEILTPSNVYAVLFYCVAVGMIVFDTLFMLVFFIAKIAGCSLAVEKKVKVTSCWISRTFSHYPYIYLFNGACIMFAIFLYIANMH